MSPKRLSYGLLLACLMLPAMSNAQAQNDAGRLVASAGRVEAKLPGASSWAPLVLMQPVPQGSTIRTLADSRARFLMSDSTILILGPGSELEISEYSFSKDRVNSLLTLFSGKLLAAVAKLFNLEKSKYEIRTPTAVAGVRGTYFYLEVSDDDGRTAVQVIHGRLNVKNIFDTSGEGLDMGGGSATTVMPGVQPGNPVQVDFERFNAVETDICAPFYTSVQPAVDMQPVYADVLARYSAQAKAEEGTGVDPSTAPASANMLAPPVQQEAFPPANVNVPVQVKINLPGTSSGALRR
jgi:hypothetical protein